MCIEKKTGVNYDYILALCREDDYVKVKSFQIYRHNLQIDRIINMIDDDNFDASDIYHVAKRILVNDEYNLCLAHEYDSTQFGKIEKVSFDTTKYFSNLCSLVEARVKRKLCKYSREERINGSIIRMLENEARADLIGMIKSDKKRLAEHILPSIYAQDYLQCLKENDIAGKNIVFSNEVHGWYIPVYKLSEDISIKIATNFCFGNSSRFLVTVIFKGIELLPYSVWVKYYNAGYSELRSCTRDYKLIRENWHECMEWLESFINSALSDPEAFVKNEISKEVYGLLNGLEEIFNYDVKIFEKEIIVKKREYDTRYIGIRGDLNPSDSEIEEYKIAPQEISMIYKIEKISGALRFLDSLKKVNEIYSDVSKVINRIIEMNKAILPDVERAIPPIVSEIYVLKKELSTLERQYKFCKSNYERLEKRLDNKLKNVDYKVKREKIIEHFIESNPRYVELKKTLSDLQEQVFGLECKISRRDKVKERLMKYKDLILQHIN